MFKPFEEGTTLPEYYVMVGPDTSDLTSIGGMEIQIATVSCDPPDPIARARLRRYENSVARNEAARRRESYEHA